MTYMVYSTIIILLKLERLKSAIYISNPSFWGNTSFYEITFSYNLPWPTSLFHKLWNSKPLPPSSHTILKEWRVRKKNQQLFGCPKAKLGPLTRRLPYSPHVNHCEIPFLTCSSPVQKQYWTQYSTDWTGNFLVLRTTSYSTVLLSPTIFHQFRFDVLDMNTLLSLTEIILGHNSHRITFPVIKFP